MNAAEDDVLRFGLRRQASEFQRVAGEVRVLIDIGALVVVAEQHGLVAEPFAGGANALMTGVVLQLVEFVEADGGSWHVRVLGHSGQSHRAQTGLAEKSSATPGQAGVTPTANLAALALGVLVTLEALEHVVAIGLRLLAGQCCRIVRTCTAAADEH